MHVWLSISGRLQQACTSYCPQELFLWPVRAFSIAENFPEARLRMINCRSIISSKLQRNRLLWPAANLCWSIWPFELSELCRTGFQDKITLSQTFDLFNKLQTAKCKYKNWICKTKAPDNVFFNQPACVQHHTMKNKTKGKKLKK